MKGLSIVSVPPAGIPDTFGRVPTDLRLSVADRSILRCFSYLLAKGLPWMAEPESLTDMELMWISIVLIGLGARQVRLTG
jgi:molybdenum cofactor biosynthesis enzyme MoaA